MSETCRAMVSTTVSHIVGKRRCSRAAIGATHYCMQHQPLAIKQRQAEVAARHATREILTPFEVWFRKEYPLWHGDRDGSQREALRRCWNAAAEECIKRIGALR